MIFPKLYVQKNSKLFKEKINVYILSDFEDQYSLIIW